MAHEDEDFWPEIIPVADDPGPVALLKQQSAKLQSKTNNALEGVVKASTERGTVYYSLYLTAPALGNYSYKLLSIFYPVTDVDKEYPVAVQDSAGNAPISITSYEAFRAWLHEQLSSDQVKRVIGNLLHVIRDAPESQARRYAREALDSTISRPATGSSPGG